MQIFRGTRQGDRKNRASWGVSPFSSLLPSISLCRAPQVGATWGDRREERGEKILLGTELCRTWFPQHFFQSKKRMKTTTKKYERHLFKTSCACRSSPKIFATRWCDSHGRLWAHFLDIAFFYVDVFLFSSFLVLLSFHFVLLNFCAATLLDGSCV